MFLPGPLLEGHAQRLAGREERARDAFRRARGSLEEFLAQSPEDPRAESSLGLALAGLGQSSEAIARARRATELYPLSLDAYVGAVRLEDLAHTHALLGDAKPAVAVLGRLLALPCMLTHNHLRLDPRWDPIRAHPDFASLVGPAT